MEFDYNGYKVNILDTPGHQDFAEDTYRTLTAVDSAIIVVDSAKGVEAQTRKLMNVCRMRRTPVIIFINKMDREGKDPFSLLDDSDSIRRWNSGELPVALIHPASAGHGLNLQAGGSSLIWFGLTWSLELYQQTNARLWRQGQTADTVVIHHIIAKDTIDERIMTALRKKEKAQTALIDAVKANLEG